MEALISGRAGIALVVDDGQLASIHADEPDKTVPRRPSEFRYLGGEARDFVVFEDVERDEIVGRLLLEQDRATALQLVLIAQDPELSDDIRREAVDELEGLLQDGEVGAYVENVLYSHPLPEGMDLAGAMNQARMARAHDLHTLLELFWTHQDEIREVREAWESIPLSDFAGEDEHWRATVVREGLFRDLARRRAARGSVTQVFTAARTRSAIRSLPNHGVVLRRWSGSLLERQRLDVPASMVAEASADGESEVH